LTGGEPLTGGPLYTDPIEFLPTHKIWLSGNHMPGITKGTDAIWERVKPIPFRNSYIGKADNTTLRDVLKAEVDGILTWLVNAAHDYISNGMPQMPDAIKIKAEEYRDDNDKLSLFIKKRVVKAYKESVRLKVMIDAYEKWCVNNGIRCDTAY